LRLTAVQPIVALRRRGFSQEDFRRKVSGCFRADTGSAAFARVRPRSPTFVWIRGYLSTLSKQQTPLLTALAALFVGEPLYPSFA
jgi:hypothetical protein